MKEPTREQCFAMFAESPVFGGADTEKLYELIAGCAEISEAAKGDTVKAENRLCYMVEGRAKVAAAGGKHTVMKELGRGDVFGCATLFVGGAVSDIKAVSDCTIVTISEDCVCEIFRLLPDAAIGYIRYLSEKIRYLNGKLCGLSAVGADEKLLSFLILESDENGKLSISAAELSRRVGIGRTSLYRSLSYLTEEKLIERDKNTIILNREKLKQ